MHLTLSQGLKVTVEESHRSPVVSAQIWLDVGSFHEGKGEEGVAHFFEHMLFKGTQRRKLGEIAQEVESHGGEMNAYTSFDQTVYYITIPSRHWALALDILSDAVLHPLFDPQEIENEKLVVFEEMARSHDSPHDMASELLLKNIFQNHPYGKPILGKKETIQNLNQKKLIQFHRKWYTPNRMTLVVAGDVNSKNILAQAKKLFSHKKKSPIKKDWIPRSSRGMTFYFRDDYFKKKLTFCLKPAHIQLSHSHLAFLTPPVVHSDIPKLDLLSSILGHGESSRLYVATKTKKKLTSSIHCGIYTLKKASVFYISSVHIPENLIPLTREIVTQINNIKLAHITPQEIDIAKKNILSEKIYEKETTDGLARKVGFYATYFNNPGEEQKYYESIKDTTTSELKDIAHKYLNLSQSTFVNLYPEKYSPKIKEFKNMMRSPRFLLRTLAMTREKTTHKIKQKSIKKYVLNGLTVLFVEDHSLPIISMRATFFGGSLYETKQKIGLTQVLTRAMTKETLETSQIELAQKVEEIAGSLEGFSGRNSSGLSLEFLSEYENLALDLFFEILLHPKFSPKILSYLKKQTLEEIKYEEDNLASKAYNNFLRKLYPHHPYGYPLNGTPQTITSLKTKNLFKAHKSIFIQNPGILTIVGSFSEDFREKIIEAAKKWEKRTKPHKKFPKILPLKSNQELYEHKTKKQVNIILGFLGAKISDQDRYALHILSTILSGQSGRLFMNLRDKESLAYSLHASNIEGLLPGHFYFYLGTSPEKLGKALNLLKKEIETLRKEKISRTEITRAKKYIIGKHEMSLQKLSTQNAYYSFDELYGLGYAETLNYHKKISQITQKDLEKVIHKYLNLNSSILSVVGPVKNKTTDK
ncbi:MAG: insulinase family protein [Deltaproteobacteria bacterium]|nr:insulinase family protein [Deltaproteobacteria bacterium]